MAILTVKYINNENEKIIVHYEHQQVFIKIYALYAQQSTYKDAMVG